MNDQPQRMLRIFFNGGYSDSIIREDFSLVEAAERLRVNGYIIVANGEGYFSSSEIKAMFIYRVSNPPQQSGDPNVIVFPKPVA
jgi:hypothetical protein